MRKWQKLSDEERKGIAESMPGGMDGLLKGWGWQQFAEKIEERLQEMNDMTVCPTAVLEEAKDCLWIAGEFGFDVDGELEDRCEKVHDAICAALKARA